MAAKNSEQVGIVGRLVAKELHTHTLRQNVTLKNKNFGHFADCKQRVNVDDVINKN